MRKILDFKVKGFIALPELHGHLVIIFQRW